MPFIEFGTEVRALGPGVLTVGSAPGAGWRIVGRGLDPVHLMLSAQPGGRALLLRGSPGSTVLVNGTELVGTRALLSFGDRIGIGTAELVYRRLASGSDAPCGYLRDVRRGRVYQLRDRSTIGRDLASTVVVHEPDVSRLHAELIRRGEAYLIVPHGVSVTSVNGGRVLTPTALQENDEIAVGRTVLRFSTALPTTTVVPREAPTRPGAGAAFEREARAATTFIGTIEAAEQRSRAARRRLTRFASIALVAIATAAVIVSLYSDAHPAHNQSARAQGRPPRRSSRGVAAVNASAARAGSTRQAALPSSPAQP